MSLYTVNDLIRVLTDMLRNDECKGTDSLFVSSDPEGNSFVAFDTGHPLGVSDARVVATRKGEGANSWLDYSLQIPEDDDDPPLEVNALILFPVHEVYV